MSSTVTVAHDHSGVRLVAHWLERLIAGDLEAAMAAMDDDIVLSLPPALPWGGIFWGFEGWREFSGRLVEAIDSELLEVTFLGADPVVASIRSRYASKASGESIEARIVEIYRVSAGRIVAIDAYYKDPGAVAALATVHREGAA